jgi:thiol-disulfide isomerase/thioredoxin
MLHQEGLKRRVLASVTALAAAVSLLQGTSAQAGGAEVAGAAASVQPLLPGRYRPDVMVPAKGKILLVNFWATWCEPCREEMPALVAAARTFAKKDLSVVLVSADTKGTSRNVPGFLVSGNVTFRCWLASSPDPQDFIDAVDPKWDGSLPHTIVYDRKGAAVESLVGLQTEASFAAAIRRALAL